MPAQKILAKSESSLRPTQPVTYPLDPRILCAIEDLLDTLAEEQRKLDEEYPNQGRGVGLAANQIEYPSARYGDDFPIPNIYVISIREPRARLEHCDPVSPCVFINATMRPLSEETVELREGCLSLIGFDGFKVPRYKAIEVSAMNPSGERIEIRAQGFIAQVHQHELEHGLGEEYLNRMISSLDELQVILDWVTQRAAGMRSESPWIIEGKLQGSERADYNAMRFWVEDALRKQERVIEVNNESAALRIA